MSIFGTRKTPDPVVTPTSPQPVVQGNAAPQPIGFETVLGANSVLEGSLRSNANVRLDGTFTGTLEIGGNVLVGETAKITADINAKNISIAGAVRGNVTGKKVQVLRTGRIWGDIHANALTTEEGAFIDGKISMVSRETPNFGQPTPAAPSPNPAPTPQPMSAPQSAPRNVLSYLPPMETPMNTNMTPDPDPIKESEGTQSDERVIEEIAPVGMGAMEEPLPTPEDPVPPGANNLDVVPNISDGHEEELNTGGDFTEGQSRENIEDNEDNPTRQST